MIGQFGSLVKVYFGFNLSFRNIEEMMTEHGIDVFYETIRRWVDKFGLTYAKRTKRRSEKPSAIWHLDEVFVRIDGKLAYLWRAVDYEGTVLDVVVQSRRNRKAALRLITKLLKNQGVIAERIVTDKLKSYGASFREIGISAL